MNLQSLIMYYTVNVKNNKGWYIAQVSINFYYK